MFFFGFVVWLPRPKFFEAPFNASACKIVNQINQLSVECVGAKVALALMDWGWIRAFEIERLTEIMADLWVAITLQTTYCLRIKSFEDL